MNYISETCKSRKFEILQKNSKDLGTIGVSYNFDKNSNEFEYAMVVEDKKLE